MSDISELIKNQLSAESADILTASSRTAESMEMNIYLVGGIVRDLLLGRESVDLDIVVAGDAVSLASRFADIVGGKMTAHPRFHTATVKWNNRSVDFVTARSETYAKPGALPVVKAGTLDADLARRDFTINAMAVDLSPERYGRLIDPFNGQYDLQNHLIRILHDGSFIDDATRIWRAVRYEQRLDFLIEPSTLKLLKQNLSMLNTISRDRIRHELELVLKEEHPEKALARAGELGVLRNVHPGLKHDIWLTDRFTKARNACAPGFPPVELYLALLMYRMDNESIQKLMNDLNLRKKQADVLDEVIPLKKNISSLLRNDIRPGELYKLINGYTEAAFTAVSIAEDNPQIQKNIDWYRGTLRNVRPMLTGTDIQNMGIPSGPRIKEILDRLLIARLDGEITSRQDEIALIENILTHP